MILFSIGCIIFYLRHRSIEDRKKNSKPNDNSGERYEKSFIQRFLKCLHRRHSKPRLEEPIPDDQSLTALLDEFSTSTVGPGE